MDTLLVISSMGKLKRLVETVFVVWHKSNDMLFVYFQSIAISKVGGMSMVMDTHLDRVFDVYARYKSTSYFCSNKVIKFQVRLQL